MRLPRTFVALLAVGTVAMGGAACGDDGADDSEPTPVSGTTPQDVEDPGEGTTPGDGGTPATEPGGVDY